METRSSVAGDINSNILVIARKLENDVETLRNLVEKIGNWALENPEEEYDGRLYAVINETLLGLTNNSGWVSYMGAALRDAK